MWVDPYLFYTMMNYPLPRQREFFSYRKSDWVWGSAHAQKPSRLEFSESYKEQCAFVTKRQWLWKLVPFLESVYVADKLSFNAENTAWDIDLFLVSNVWRMRHVKFRSTLFAWRVRLMRIAKKWSFHFTLNFTVARDHCDLQTIKLVPHDPYLIYWIAHLVPIYQQFDHHELNIWKENKWIQYYLPDHPLQQTIFLDCEKSHWRVLLRKKIERISQWLFGDFVEWLLRSLRIPVLLRRRNKMWAKGEWVIIAPKMLKFHYDKRENYALKWKVSMK